MDLWFLISSIICNIFCYVLLSQAEKLKVSTILQEPYLFNAAKKGKTPEYHGYIKDLLDKLSEDAGFTYEFVPTSDGEFGRQSPNGTWTGTIQQLISGKADMIAGPLTVTAMRAEVIDFTHPFQITNLVLVLRRPDQEKLPVADRIKRIWSPFESSVWLLAVAAYFLTSSAIYIISYFNPYDWRRMARDGEATLREGESFTCMNSFWFSLSALTLQGYIRTPRSVGARVVVTAWWMFIIVLISCYISKLSSLLQIRPNEEEIEGYMRIRGLEDVLMTNTKFAVLKGGAVDEFLDNSKMQVLQRIKADLREGGNGEYVRSLQEGIEKIQNYPSGRKTFITESLMVKYHAQKYSCQFYFVDTNTIKRQYSLGFRKNSPRTDEIGRYILKYNELGILNQMEQKWFKGNCKQYVFEGSDDKYKIKEFSPLDTASFSGALIVLAVGLLAGIIITVGEYLIFKWAESGDHENHAGRHTPGNKQPLSLLGQQQDHSDTTV